MGFEDKLYYLLDYYYKLPAPISDIAGKIYRALPYRLTKGSAYSYFYALASSEAYDPDYVEKEFLNTVSHASTVHFYQELYSEYGVSFASIKDLRDISRLPTISKLDVQKNCAKMIVPGKRHKGLYLTTGGSTGIPVGFYLEKGKTRAKEAAFISSLWSKFGFSKKSKVAIIRGVTIHSLDKICRFDSIKNALLLSSSHLTRDNVATYVEKLNLFRPDFIQAYPSSIYLLARLMRDLGIGLSFSPKMIFCGSENLYSEHLHLIEQVFKSKIFSWYGHTERVLLAKINDKLGYDFLPSYGVPELIDQNGCPVVNGVGELCGTSLHNGVMPLIRYRTDDFAIISKQPSLSTPPGSLTVDKIEGRRHEFIYSFDRRPVSMTTINMHSAIFDRIERFQFVQEAFGFVSFTYTARNQLSSQDIAAIRLAISNKLGEGFDLKVQQVGNIEITRNGKQSFLIQKLVV